MKYIKMKIRPHFLDLIRNGVKTHEYRLADPKYSDINVGDVFILVSTQNDKDFTKVKIDGIEKYKSWEEALRDKWQDDFKGLFSSFSAVLKEFHRFYTKEKVETYGIEVFNIRIIRKPLSKARFLLDTNTIIEREGYNNVSSEVAYAYNWIDKLKGTKIIHPKTIDEINKYKNEKIKETILIKLDSYEKLIPSVETTNEFERVCSDSRFAQDENSKIDNEILLQVYNGTVDYLVTSDNAILHKAELLYIRDSVYSPNDLIARFEKENPKLIDYDVLSVKLEKIGNLDITDSFFNSLREDYNGSEFNDWLKRKNSEEAYVFNNNDGLQGFLYLKTEDENENYSHFVPPFKPAIRLKVGTFKISTSGLRLGERFLKIIFDNALKRNVDEVYVTLFENKREEVIRLKTIMEKWGFVKKAKNIKNGETVLVKDMRHYDYTKSPMFNYPLIKDTKSITIMPIYAAYHTKLFPDLHLSNEDMHLYDEEACRYAIEKIYVCGKQVYSKPGDIALIYRMADYNKTYRSVISGDGIIQEVITVNSIDELIANCKNKSVFTEDNLRDLYYNRHYRTVVKILFLHGLASKVNLKKLQDLNILNDLKTPQFNTILSIEDYDLIKKLGKGED